MNDQQIIRWLWRYGHFANKRFANPLNVKESDLKFLRITDRVVQDAAASIQSLDLQAELLVHKHHDGRALQIDGDIGPATKELLTKPRCGCPDYRRDDEATGSGPWPVPGCDPMRKNRAKEHSIRINVNTAGMPYSLDYWKSFIGRTVRCAAEFGLSARYILDGDPSKAEIAVTFASLADDGSGIPEDAVIGRNYFPQRGTYNQTIKGWITTRWNPSSIILHSCLWMHEQLGHGAGFEHTRGGIMNPSILPIDPLTWRGDPHESRARDWYGGEWVRDEGPTIPTPQPPEDGPQQPTGFVYLGGELYNVRVWK